MSASTPWPTDEELAADDAAHEQRTYDQQLDMDIAREARRIKVRDAAQARVRAELVGPAPPFDAGLLGDVLDRAPAPDPRVESLVPWEAGTLVVAQRKTGKTTLELNLAHSLIDGHDFLGRFGVTKLDGNVAVLNYEVSGHTIATWAHEHGIPHHRLLLVNLRGRRNPLRDDDGRARLIALLRQHDVETLIVDPFGRAYTGTSQNDPGEVGAWLADLDQVTRQDGAGCRDLILAAHAGWHGERSRGSTALEDWADSIVTLTRDEDQRQRFLRAEGRDVLLDEDQLNYDTTSRTLTLAGTGSRKTTAKVRQIEALMPTVLDILKASPIPLSGNKLDAEIKSLIASGDLDAKHSKGDGARAANLLTQRSLVFAKDGPRGARLFHHLTSPTSPDLPRGTQGDFPTSPIGEVAQGSHQPHLPNDQEQP